MACCMQNYVLTNPQPFSSSMASSRCCGQNYFVTNPQRGQIVFQCEHLPNLSRTPVESNRSSFEIGERHQAVASRRPQRSTVGSSELLGGHIYYSIHNQRETDAT